MRRLRAANNTKSITSNVAISNAPPPSPSPDDCGAADATIVIDADPERVKSWFETAVTVTVAGDGTLAGAVNTPLAEIVPSVVLPPAIPPTCHVTVISAAFVTVAADRKSTRLNSSH